MHVSVDASRANPLGQGWQRPSVGPPHGTRIRVPLGQLVHGMQVESPHADQESAAHGVGMPYRHFQPGGHGMHSVALYWSMPGAQTRGGCWSGVWVVVLLLLPWDEVKDTTGWASGGCATWVVTVVTLVVRLDTCLVMRPQGIPVEGSYMA